MFVCMYVKMRRRNYVAQSLFWPVFKCGSTAFKVQKDGCGVPSAARALLGPEGL